VIAACNFFARKLVDVQKDAIGDNPAGEDSLAAMMKKGRHKAVIASSHSQLKMFMPLAVSAVSVFSSSAQEDSAVTRYIMPMDIPIELSGNFMEPRSDHFHGGIDIRTQSREGIPVKAVADGWVSRIKINPWGYGKAVYIEHPNGHTSVYGHLKELKGPVAEYCREAQYKAKDFSIDVHPEKDAIPVKQGEIFALSGNTGGSGGPHLHFEIRRNNDQHAIDPETVGFAVKDRTPPEIRGIGIHALNDTSRVAPYAKGAKGFAVQGGSGKFNVKPGETIAGYGTVGLTIHALDRYDGSGSKFGVRKIELFVDSMPVFTSTLDHIDFDNNRYCNAHMDFSRWKQGRMHYHRCFKLPNNKLKIYGNEPEQGRIALEQGKERHIRFVVTDGAGNRSELQFMLKGGTLEEALKWPSPPLEGSLFRYDVENVLAEEGITFTLPANALYDDLYFKYERLDPPAKAVTPLHVLHDHLTPLHVPSQLKIDVSAVPERLREKAFIVRIEPNGSPSPIGGRLADSTLTASIKALGRFTVMIDTIAPTITNIDLRADMKGRDSFNLQIKDDFSGIGQYKGSINGEWILMEYEPKEKRLTHYFDKHTSDSGQKEFKLELTDDRGNAKTWTMKFTR
jgi:murein DD-endopeptidase MepM/ murein hydrolase activator NlpD